MPSRDLSQDRASMLTLGGKSGKLPRYGGPEKPGVWALVKWSLRSRPTYQVLGSEDEEGAS